MAFFQRKPRPEPPAPPRDTPELVLRRLEWTVLRRLDGLLQGDYRTLWRGTGLDLADLREYQHHDDVRHIDWNVTARLQQPYVREFHEDREMSAWFLLDLSPSVDFGSGEVKKTRVSSEFVAVLSRILTRHGNRVGAVLYRKGIEAVLPARGGRQQVLQLLGRMLPRPRAVEPSRPARRGAAAPEGGVTQLADLLRAGERMMKRRSMVFVVSDFISQPGWAAALGRLAQRHDVVAVRLVDPMERALPNLGMVVMRDAETGEQLLVDTSDPGFRVRFETLAAQREDELMNALTSAGVDAIELATDDDLVDALMRFADLRRQRRRMGAGGGVPQHLRSRDHATRRAAA